MINLEKNIVFILSGVGNATIIFVSNSGRKRIITIIPSETTAIRHTTGTATATLPEMEA
jgi:hypothetical protein